MIYAFNYFSVPPKFLETPKNHVFRPEHISIGDMKGANPTCIICFNCTVFGIPEPVVTWEYQTMSMSEFMPVVTNQSNTSSSYFVQDNGHVSTIPTVSTFINLLFLYFTEVML